MIQAAKLLRDSCCGTHDGKGQNHGLQRRPRLDVFEVESRSRGPAEPCRYLACMIEAYSLGVVMAVEWSTEIIELLKDARRLSDRLGHFEIVTLAHVYGVALSRLRGWELHTIELTIGTIDPPWPDNAVYLSPGGQTPSLKRALEHAIIHAQNTCRAVTIQDIWSALPNGDRETVRQLDQLFGVDRQITKR